MSAAPLLRPARPDEAARLSRIAQAAKAALGYSAELLESWRAELTIDPDLLQRQTIWVLECDGALQGFFSLHAFRGGATLSHLWVDPPAQRRGFGSMLLRKALQLAAAGRAQTLQVDAEPSAETFYRRHGLEKVGEIAAPIPGEPQRVRPQMRVVFGVGRSH
ncbi:MAG TPA: GNAT family N-acetyltransferase [Nevskia sp.]|nr:GNAT family N-acetyltransferase [Nevskia sp.]